MIDKMREEFERWYSSNYDVSDKIRLMTSGEVVSAWRVWQHKESEINALRSQLDKIKAIDDPHVQIEINEALGENSNG